MPGVSEMPELGRIPLWFMGKEAKIKMPVEGVRR